MITYVLLLPYLTAVVIVLCGYTYYKIVESSGEREREREKERE